ncbi:sugar phosphate nucleotidyltransferase, partial [Saprospiraceae bacterium]|nr:sugar phosphate nucleotidyltransferase [Saprospiraceae bacterium]
TIIDYSVYDAIRAGFGKVVFVIRKNIEKAFKEKVSNKFKGEIEVAFAFQEKDAKIEGIDKMPDREKPWGTGHAVLVAQDLVNEPFAIVNADDYYGIEALQKVADFLINDCNEKHYSMVGFHLKNTISENGSVSRGVCSTDKNDCLSTVTERTSIRRIDKTICYEENGEKIFLKDDTIVSMNLWGFHNNIFEHTRKMFVDFVKNNPEDPKAEFYIPLVANDLLEKKAIELKVLTSTEKWYGVTYKEDKDDVVTAMKNLHSSGKYPKALWNIEID